MSAQDCARKAYVKLQYLPPVHSEVPVSCQAVTITKPPELVILDDRIDAPPVVELHCAVPTVEGVGGVILLVQMSVHIVWEVSFLAKRGLFVNETHKVLVSMPMLFKLSGPRMMLNAISPWKVKLIPYVGILFRAFRKLEQVDAVLAKVAVVKHGFCPKDVALLKAGLQMLEAELGHYMRSMSMSSEGDGELARSMLHRPFDTGRFPDRSLA